jgi:hypothetical protein
VRLAHLRVGAYRQDISFERSGNWVEHAKVRLAHLRVGAYRQDISFERSGNWVEHAKCVWHT